MQKDVWTQALSAYRVRRSRSLNATHIELQSFMCEDIVERIEMMTRDVSSMLFMEAGPDPSLSRRCAEAAGAKHLVLADSSATMLSLHRAHKKIVYDPSSRTAFPFKPGIFDLIAGYVPLQCYPYPNEWLCHARRLLKPGGMLLINFFGETTLHEIRKAVLKEELLLSEGAASRVLPMIDVKSAGTLLQSAGFKLCVSDVSRHTLEYDSYYAVLSDLKCLGYSGLSGSNSMSKALYAMLCDRKHNINVSVDVICLTGER